MIHENNLRKYLWVEAVNTICYVQNRIYSRPILNKTSYELFKGRKLIFLILISLYVHVTFKTIVYLNKFDVKA